MINLVLADDHPIVLSGLENMFRRERDCRVVASCGENTIGKVQAKRNLRSSGAMPVDSSGHTFTSWIWPVR